MSYFYKPPKNKFSYITFFIYIYLTSFIIFVIGRVLGDLIFVFFGYADLQKTILWIQTYYTTRLYWEQVFFPFLFSIPIIIIGGLIAYILNLANLGARFMTGIYIRLASGKIGNLIGLIPLFDFGGTWVVESKAKEEVNFSTGRGMFKEFVFERGSDVLVFSSLVGGLVLVILDKLQLVSLDVTNFPSWSHNLINFADLSTIATAFVTLFVLCLYIPSMWIFKDGEVKKIVFAKGKDVTTATNVAETYRQGLGTFIGFSGIVGIASIAISSSSLLHFQSTLYEYLAVYSYSIAFFLIMASILLPGICITMLRYMKKHEQYVINTRQFLIKRGTGKSGSIQFTEVHILREMEAALKRFEEEEKEGKTE